jgi:hypothetical protein
LARWRAARQPLAVPEYRADMTELVEALSLVALTASTLGYAIVMRHREERRDALRWQADVRESLLSVGRIAPSPVRRWSEDGTRFRAD